MDGCVSIVFLPLSRGFRVQSYLFLEVLVTCLWRSWCNGWLCQYRVFTSFLRFS